MSYKIMLSQPENLSQPVMVDFPSNFYPGYHVQAEVIEEKEKEIDEIFPNLYVRQLVLREVQAFKNDRRIIEAIKVLRVTTGWGLKKAKEYVENMPDKKLNLP